MTKRNDFLKALARCRLISKEAVENSEDLDGMVVAHLLDDKLISEEIEDGKRFFVLTDKGETFVKQEIKEVSHLYRGFVLEQDLALIDFYSKLDKNQADSWVTKDDFIVKYQLPGTVDGAYVNERGDLVAVKVLSGQASFNSVERVENFISQAGIKQIHYIVYTPAPKAE